MISQYFMRDGFCLLLSTRQWQSDRDAPPRGPVQRAV